MFCHRSIPRLLITVTIVALTLGGLSSTVQGTTVQTSNVKINGGTADFGFGSHSFGRPDGNGVIQFDYDFPTIAGQLLVATGTVAGTLYWDSLDPGCARLIIEYRNFFGSIIHTTPDDDRFRVCGPGGNANLATNQRQVNFSFSDPSLFTVVIRTREVRFDGSLVGTGSASAGAPHTRRLSAKINSGTADFGSGLHVLGAPSGFGEIQFTRGANGLMFGVVTGTLYWDALFSSGCARIIIDFKDINFNTFHSVTRTRCGPGGNANDPANQRAINESLDATDGRLFQIRLRVGTVVADGSFQNVTSQTFPFQGTVGTFELTPTDPTVAVHEQLHYAFTWTVPEPLNWHDLRSLQLRIRDDTETILCVLFDEDSNTFSLFNEATGRFGKGFAPGSHKRLQTPQATLYLAHISVEGSGPTGPSVTLHLPLSFKPSAARRSAYIVEVAASDNEGNEDPFVQVGTLTVTE